MARRPTTTACDLTVSPRGETSGIGGRSRDHDANGLLATGEPRLRRRPTTIFSPPGRGRLTASEPSI
jgi:hypothetical protein